MERKPGAMCERGSLISYIYIRVPDQDIGLEHWVEQREGDARSKFYALDAGI